MRRLLIPALALLLLAPVACDDDVTVNVPDFTPPTVQIVAPAADEWVHGPVTVTAMAADPSGVDRIELWVDGANTGLVAEVEPYAFVWDTAGLADMSEHVLVARAFDAAGVPGDSAPRLVTVVQSPDIPFLQDMLATNDLGLTLRELMEECCVFLTWGGTPRIHFLEFRCQIGGRVANIPPSIGSLEKLEEFAFDNGVADSLPEEFGDLGALKSLSLGFLPNLTRLPDSFGDLTSLRSLGFTQLIHLEAFPGSIAGLSSLEEMYLDTCRAFTVTAELCALPALRSLVLHNCDLMSLPAAFGNLTTLINLDLSSNQFADWPESISHLTNLTSLDLANNDLEEAPAWLSQLQKLRRLEMAAVGLSEFPASVMDLPELEYLDLGFNRITSLPPDFCDLAAGMGVPIWNWFSSSVSPNILLRYNALFCDGDGVDPDLLPDCLRTVYDAPPYQDWVPDFMDQDCGP